MFEQLVDIICNYVEIEQEDIKPESRFMEDLGFTSFDFMSMLGEIEDEMDVEIEQDKAADIRTVGEAVAKWHVCLRIRTGNRSPSLPFHTERCIL